MNIVTSVAIKKKGVNERTGKPWTAFEVELDDGRVASGFDLVKVGDPVEIEEKGDFLNYFKFKPPQKGAVQAPGGPPARLNGAGLDQRQRAIIRQHSQSMAVEVLKLKVQLNELLPDDLTPRKLKELADYFDNDVYGAAKL
jgi:hypothetical protein